MSYYGDSMSYYYGGAFANHSSLMTGTGRVYTPLRFAPHLSTISESPLSGYRRYAPVVLPSRPKRIIDTSDIDVSTPRHLHSDHSRPGNRLRRDRPTIRIRSQAMKDNPILREHNERHEKTVGELLREKFFIKDKKPSSDGPKDHHQASVQPIDDPSEAPQGRLTRRMTRRRSSADIQMDPGQLERELAIAQVQAEVLDNLVAEEQAEIEVEVRRGTLLHKNQLRSGAVSKSESETDKSDDTKKKIPKKIKKKKKTTDKPSPPPSTPSTPADDVKDAGKLFKIEACNSVGDLSTILINAKDQQKRIDQFRESIRLPPPKTLSVNKKMEGSDEEVVVLPIKKPYILDNSRNSVHLTLKPQIAKSLGPREDGGVGGSRRSLRFKTDHVKKGSHLQPANIRAKDTLECDTEVESARVAIDDADNDDMEVGGIEESSIARCGVTSEVKEFMKASEDLSRIEEIVGPGDEEEDVDGGVGGHVETVNLEKLENLPVSTEEIVINESAVVKIHEVLTRDFGKDVCEVLEDMPVTGDDDGEGSFWGLRGAGTVDSKVVDGKNDNLVGGDSNIWRKKDTELVNAIREEEACELKISNGESNIQRDTSKKDESLHKLKSSLSESKISVKSKPETLGDKSKLLAIESEIPNLQSPKPEIVDNRKIVDELKKSAEQEISAEDKKLYNEIHLSPLHSKMLPETEVKEKERSEKLKSTPTESEATDIKVEPTENSKLLISKYKYSSTESVTLPSMSPPDLPKVKPKAKMLSTSKFLSADSGLGSLDLTVNPPAKKIKKKVLQNSKGSSFECDEDTKPKLSDSSARKKIKRSEKTKIPPVKKLKKKLTSAKSLPLPLPDDSSKDIILTRVTSAKEKSLREPFKSLKPFPLTISEPKPLPPLKEDEKSEQEVDFWSEIHRSNTPKMDAPKLSLKPQLPVEIIKQEVKPNASAIIQNEPIAKEEEEVKVPEAIFDNSLSSENPFTSERNCETSETTRMTVLLSPVSEAQSKVPENDIPLVETTSTVEAVSTNALATTTTEDAEDIPSLELAKEDDKPVENIPEVASGPSTPVLEVPPLLNIEPITTVPEVPDILEIKQDITALQEDDEDESPMTPTNEDTSVGLSKWDKTTDLTILDGQNVPSSGAETGNEVATPKVSKKKLSRRKKSGSEDTIKRRVPEKAASNSTEVCKVFQTAKKTSKTSPPKTSTPKTSPPKTSPPKATKRPVDLKKMFYTTPSSLLTATPRDLSKVTRVKVKKDKHPIRTPSASSDSTGSTRSSQDTSSRSNSTEVEDESGQKRISSTRSNDSGFDGSPRLSNCDMACHKKCEKLTGNLCGLNQKLVAEALQALKRAPSQSSDNQRNSDSSDHVHGSGRITPPATNLPRFKKYTVEDFHFLKVLGKGSFGKVLLAELRGTDCVYAVKCLKKDVVLEDDDVECTLIERKVLTLATRHPYLCHLFCTFQTDSHLFFVMEYLNGGDLMFHIQKSGRFPEFRARFYAGEIWSGLNFLHKKGIVYRDLKLDNVLLDFEGHIRIADFGMCKLQIFLDRTADTFCGTPDYMAPEIIKGLKYNQAVDWWSFGVLLYEMLTGQSPFSGCDEDELFWSICNERPFIPRYLTQEAMDILVVLLEKDAGKRPMGHEIQTHAFFHSLSWDRLERRLVEPPFKPALDHTLDTRYFDTAFTAEKPRLTPVPEQILTSMDQGVFRGFSYTNPNATD